jgi:hypothetical protein
MKISEISKNDTLYHVTLTSNIDKIKKAGLLMMQKSNWVKAGDKERYGNGEIYAFDHMSDAIRWAAKWDWDLNKTIGSGKVSIITFNDDKSLWVEDDSDPLAHAGSFGKWFKKVGRVSPDAIQDIVPVTPAAIRSIIHSK